MGRLQTSWLVLCWLVVGSACSSGHAPLDLATLDPSQNQELIAMHYRSEASRLRQKAEEQVIRAEAYTQLFGSDSDWVRGARLLAQSYEEAARELDHLADRHLRLTGRFSPSQAIKPARH